MNITQREEKSPSGKIITMEARDFLRKKGIKATVPRVRVIECLLREHAPRTVSELAQTLTTIDPVTVYRSMQLFLKHGIVREVDLRVGAVAYEMLDEGDHHHLVCVGCKVVEDFTGCGFEKLSEIALKQSVAFAEVKSHSFELFGMCKSCARV